LKRGWPGVKIRPYSPNPKRIKKNWERARKMKSLGYDWSNEVRLKEKELSGKNLGAALLYD
jgi:hypothetical protein